LCTRTRNARGSHHTPPPCSGGFRGGWSWAQTGRACTLSPPARGKFSPTLWACRQPEAARRAAAWARVRRARPWPRRGSPCCARSCSPWLGWPARLTRPRSWKRRCRLRPRHLEIAQPPHERRRVGSTEPDGVQRWKSCESLRFRDARRFPSPVDCRPRRGLHVRRERLGFVPRSRAIFCRPVPNPKRPIRKLFHPLGGVRRASWGFVPACPIPQRPFCPLPNRPYIIASGCAASPPCQRPTVTIRNSFSSL
jgi:hypothetical protein